MCEANNKPDDLPLHEIMRSVADLLAVMSIDEIRELTIEIEEVTDREK